MILLRFLTINCTCDLHVPTSSENRMIHDVQRADAPPTSSLLVADNP